MQRLILQAMLKMGAKVLVLTAGVAVIVGILGYVRQWNSPLVYSNAFFVAGCLVLIAGTASHYTAGVEWQSFQLIHPESTHNLSSSERLNVILQEGGSVSRLILGVLSGLLLILFSAIAASMV